MSTPTAERRVEYMPLQAVEPALRNPKLHAHHEIRASIGRFGLAEVPLLDERTGHLVAGHGRIDQLSAMRDDGETPPDGVRVDPVTGDWLTPVIRGWSSRSDVEAEAYLVASNNLSTLGGWDQHALTTLLKEIADEDDSLLALTGWDGDDLADMLKLLEPPDLDELGEQLGDPDPADNWPIIRVKVPKHVAAAWRSHVETHDGDESAAFAALLEMDPGDPVPSDWQP